MRYWFRRENRVQGPLEAEEILRQPGFGPRSMVCPEGRDPSDRRQWLPLRSIGALRARLKSRPHRAEPPADAYFVISGLATHGPLRLDEVRRLPALCPDTPVCPARLDPGQGRNWSVASSIPGLLPETAVRLGTAGGVSPLVQIQLASASAARSADAAARTSLLWLLPLSAAMLLASWMLRADSDAPTAEAVAGQR